MGMTSGGCTFSGGGIDTNHHPRLSGTPEALQSWSEGQPSMGRIMGGGSQCSSGPQHPQHRGGGSRRGRGPISVSVRGAYLNSEHFDCTNGGIPSRWPLIVTGTKQERLVDAVMKGPKQSTQRTSHDMSFGLGTRHPSRGPGSWKRVWTIPPLMMRLN